MSAMLTRMVAARFLQRNQVRCAAILTQARAAASDGTDGRAVRRVAAATAAAGVAAVVCIDRGPPAVAEADQAKRSVITDYYELGDLLGEGGYGMVHMATRKANSGAEGAAMAARRFVALARSAVGLEREDSGGEASKSQDVQGGAYVAVKKVDKELMTQKAFLHEFNALKAIHDAGGHPNIAGMLDMFEDEERYYLVLELVSGGELFEHLIRNGAYSEQTAAAILRDLAAALRFLHRKGIVHADLKPENLMLSSWDDDNATVKLVDFGCSCGTGLPPPEPNSGGGIITGTPAYWPPELVIAKSEGIPYSYNAALDMWALGVIMYIMLVGAHPFDLEGGAVDADMLPRIADPKVPESEGLTDHLSEAAIDLMRKLMEKDPRKRLTADAMLKHPWTTGEQASGTLIEGVDEKLASFQQVVKSNLESSLFALLVKQSLSHGGNQGEATGNKPIEEGPASVEEAVDVIRQAFSSFDKEGKGFVSAKDISRVLAESGEEGLSEEESSELDEAVENSNQGQNGVSMDSFAKMMSSLETVTFQRGDVVFAEGEDVDASPFMYIIGSGKVDLLKGIEDGAPPVKFASLTSGDIFGETAMIQGGYRSATVQCATPVQAVRLGKDSLGRMMKRSKMASANLREMSILRDIGRAKALLKAVQGITQRSVPPGAVVVKQGGLGDSMFTVVKGKLDVRVKGQRGSNTGDSESEYGEKIASLSVGDIFGEMALMLKQPRSATVVCSSAPHGGSTRRKGGEAGGGSCVVNEIKGDDFVRMLKESDSFLNSMTIILRTRMFRSAMLRLSEAGGDALSEETMRAAFNAMDLDKTGYLHASEVSEGLRNLKSELNERDVQALLALADRDQDGSLCFEEFCRFLQWGAREEGDRGPNGDTDPA